MKVGVSLGLGDLTSTPELIEHLVPALDESGFSTIWVSEHVAWFANPSRPYPYARARDSIAGPENISMPSPWIFLSFAAAHSKRIRLGTGVALVPEYHPLITAKLAASLDHSSGGRFVLGTGAGWLKDEFEALGVPWERRFKRLEDYVRVLRGLWANHSYSHESEFVSFEDVISYPKPARPEGIPIIGGGQTDNALKRAARFCDGIYMYNLTVDEAAERVKILRQELDAAGRDESAFEISVAISEEGIVPRDRAAYEQIGIDEVVITYPYLYAAGANSIATCANGIRSLANDWLG